MSEKTWSQASISCLSIETGTTYHQISIIAQRFVKVSKGATKIHHSNSNNSYIERIK